VDLNGAFAGTPVNGEIVAAIARQFPDLPIQIGGGIRNLEAARFYIDAGVSYLIIGTQAVKDPEFVQAASALLYPARGLFQGIVGKHGGVFHAPLAQAYTLPIFQVNCGYH
jgi:phosphoribosylformimino-5-aminoimidazole carboxamide ribonucleotide (ProFAR) isomerase